MKLIQLVLIFTISSSIFTMNLKSSSNKIQNNDNDEFNMRDDLVYDRDLAITFTKKLAKIIIDVPNEPIRQRQFLRTFEECFNNFESKPAEYDPIIKSFYMKCFEMRKEVSSKWNNKIFNDNIMTKLATEKIQDKGEDSTCQVALPFVANVDNEKVIRLFRNTFSQFVSTPSTAKPFITSMYSRYRESLPDNAFTNINRESGATVPSENKKERSGASSKEENGVVDNSMSKLGNRN